MRIERLEVNHRNIKLRKTFKTALRTATEIDSIEVTIHLSNGIIGKGAAAPTWVITGDSSESIQSALLGPIKQAIIGKDIYFFRSLLNEVQNSCIGNPSAKAAADIALHDAYSKLLDIPLYHLLGDNKQLKTCMTVGVDTPEKMSEDAGQAVKDGFHALKIKVGSKPELDIDRISAIQAAIPSNIALRLDANQGWAPKQAVQLINQMENENPNIEFIEQPVDAHDLEGLKFVTNNVNTRVMADESLFSPKDALKLINGYYVDLLNIKLMKCGGIANAWNIASIAETAGIECMIGSMMESSLSVAAAAHVATAHPNIIYYDLDAPLWLEEKTDPIIYKGEEIILDSKPGLSLV